MRKNLFILLLLSLFVLGARFSSDIVGYLTVTNDLKVDGDIDVDGDIGAFGDIEFDATGALYYGDSDDNNTWKTVRDGTKLSFQRREAGAYVEKGFFDSSFHTPGLHAEVLSGIAGSICLHEGNSPLADPTGGSLWTDSSGDLFLLLKNATPGTKVQNKIVKEDASGNAGIGVSASSRLHIKANVPGTVGSHPAGQLIIQDPDDSVFGVAVITGYESDGAGNPDQQLWYLGSQGSANSDVLFSNRRNASLGLGTNDTTRMTIDGSGYVGIGTASPKRQFDFDGANARTQRYLDTDLNTSLGYETFGAGNLAHTTDSDGYYNNAFGRQSVYSITDGFGNCGFGSGALYSTTEGEHNIGIGYAAADANATGNHNIGIGYKALDDNTAGIGNIALGYYTANDLTGSYNIIIGYEVDAPIAAGDSQLNIGNLIFGTGLTNDGSLSTGNVGIGTTGPDSTLHVIGGVCIEASDSGCSQSAGSVKATNTIYAAGGGNEEVNAVPAVTIGNNGSMDGFIFFDSGQQDFVLGLENYGDSPDKLQILYNNNQTDETNVAMSIMGDTGDITVGSDLTVSSYSQLGGSGATIPKIKTWYKTGVLPAGVNPVVATGINVAKVLHWSAIIREAVSDILYKGGGIDDEADTKQFDTWMSANGDINFVGLDGSLQTDYYQVFVIYFE